MRPSVVRRPLLLSALVAGIAGCGSPTDTPPPGEAALRLPGAPALELSAAIAPERIAFGESSLLTVRLRNTGAEDVRLVFPTGCQLGYEVVGPDGRAAQPEGGGYICTQAQSDLDVPAGSTVERQFPWTATRFDSPPYTRAWVEPGNYRFVPVLHAWSGQAEAARGPAVALRVVDTATYGARPGIGVGARVSRSPVAPGDTATVVVSLRNLTARAVTMRFRSTCQTWLDTYRDNAMSALPMRTEPQGCGDAITSLTVAAGATVERRIPWRAVDADGRALGAGGYAIVARLGQAPHEQSLSAPVAFVRVGR